MKIDKFRANLKSRIKERGFTQEEFSNAIGISNAALKKYMSNGKNTSLPDVETFDNMCTILDCDCDYLMGKIDKPRKDIAKIGDVTGLSYEVVNKLNWYKENNDLYLDLLNFILENKHTSDLLYLIYEYITSEPESFITSSGDRVKNIKVSTTTKDYVRYSNLDVNVLQQLLLMQITQLLAKAKYDYQDEIEKTTKRSESL